MISSFGVVPSLGVVTWYEGSRRTQGEPILIPDAVSMLRGLAPRPPRPDELLPG